MKFHYDEQQYVIKFEYHTLPTGKAIVSRIYPIAVGKSNYYHPTWVGVSICTGLFSKDKYRRLALKDLLKDQDSELRAEVWNAYLEETFDVTHLSHKKLKQNYD